MAKSIANDTNKRMASSQPHTSSDMSTKSDESDQHITLYKVGDYVRATYHSDNIDYEAQVVSINEDIGECVIKFIGYDNEQTVRLVDLVDSWGEEEQQKQELEAAADVEESNDDSEDYPQEVYRNDDLQKSPFPMPPIPPMPPMLKDSLGDDSEHFSAMLMSWYMSGYYTGLFQGHKLAKQQNKKLFKRK